jgi:hypothetical protein
MKQFIVGFVTACLLWVALLVAESAGVVDILDPRLEEPDAGVAPVSAAVDEDDSGDDKKKRRKRGRRIGRRDAPRRGEPQAPEYDMSEGVAGDDLGSPGAREIGMGSGGVVDQLSPAEIDRGIDRVWSGLQRCLLALPPGVPNTGKIVLGMHIASSGRVTKVNLTGPNAMISGEAGACFRRTTKSVQYRSFDGPDMIARYPITFD